MCNKGNNSYWLTLVIPTYNCEKYLDETLGSVLGQLPEDAELIIVDDGSTDGTVKRLAALRDDPKENVRILLREHGGVSVARNAGIDAASGEWIAFMDCDDCLEDGFFGKSRELIRDNVDLYIFSFERVELIPDGVGFAESATPMAVDDRFYATASDFADDYIRSRHLLVYSACNKFYRRSVINEHHIRFQKGLEFGEDRLFNYDYLEFCGSIVTSRLEMFRYMQRNADSASNKFLPNHRETVMKLHEAKMKCFTGLSKGTTESEKMEFIEYDLATEIERMEGDCVIATGAVTPIS